MPLAINIANELVKTATNMIEKKQFSVAKYDMKSQVSLISENGKYKIDTIVMSIQHNDGIDLQSFRKFVKDKIIIPIIKKYKMNLDFKLYINFAGQFVIGGPIGDTGLTGRKLMVDNYGPEIPHGGGAFSGKDSTKVDRSGAYFAR
jgi:S-adenosylmethionine synthetase